MVTSAHPTVQRVSGPSELIAAIPYLLGFHPSESLVIVGLRDRRLVVTARLDLVDAVLSPTVEDTVDALHRGGSRELVAAVFDDGCPVAGTAGADLPWAHVVGTVARAAAERACTLPDALLVSAGRWWSYLCARTQCCPPEGQPIDDRPSAFAAAATYEGMVALPDRAALAASLDPLPDDRRAALEAGIEAAENASVAAVLDGRGEHHQRAAKRAIFRAARASGDAGWPAPNDSDVARMAVALGEIAVRDALWLAVDDGRLDGRSLWRELSRRAPAPYDAAALFLLGWASWRAGDGALAGIAAQRCVLSDPSYSAADLLLAALAQGVDPRTFPGLRGSRSRSPDGGALRVRPRRAPPGAAARTPR